MSDLITQREITIFNTQSNERQVLQSTARTWGDLQQELGGDFSKSKMVLQQSRLTLENTEAELPSESFTLFKFPRQSKAGMGVDNINKGNYHRGNFSPLRTFCKKMTGTAPNGKQACIDALDAHYGKTSPKVEAPKAKSKSKVTAKAEPKFKRASQDRKMAEPKSDINEKVSNGNGTLMSKSTSTLIIGKLNTIIDKLDAAIPSIGSKELDKLRATANSVKQTMQSMR